MEQIAKGGKVTDMSGKSNRADNQDTQNTGVVDTQTQERDAQQQAADNQQNANAQAQDNAYSGNTNRGTMSRQKVQELDPNDVRRTPGYFPQAHAAEAITYNAIAAREQHTGKADPAPFPDSAQPLDPFSAVYVPMPSGGINALAESLYPEDYGNLDKMAGHIADLMTMNRDTIRDDTSYRVGTQVRIK